MNEWEQRQKALADFGVHALRSFDLRAILDQACGLISRIVRAPVVKVLECKAENSDLVLRAAVGLAPENAQVDVTCIPGGKRSAAGYAVLVKQPVFSHIPTETRFVPSELVIKSNIVYSANCLILLEDNAYGVLEVDRTTDECFTEADVQFLQTYAHLLSAAIVRQRNAARIGALLREKELLFQELQHRVRNDLQMVMTLLMMEARDTADPEAKSRLQKMQTRIDALRLVHQRLSDSGDVDRVPLADYLRELATSRFEMQGLDPAGTIRLELDLVPVDVGRDRAIALGLIANEFITNSLKYAFGDGRGSLRIAVTPTNDKRVRLALIDSGPGIAATATGSRKGLGLRLIDLLAQQIDAHLDRSEQGNSLSVTFANVDAGTA
jgi:two-component sensor histidine kinase